MLDAAALGMFYRIMVGVLLIIHCIQIIFNVILPKDIWFLWLLNGYVVLYFSLTFLVNLIVAFAFIRSNFYAGNVIIIFIPILHQLLKEIKVETDEASVEEIDWID